MSTGAPRSRRPALRPALAARVGLLVAVLAAAACGIRADDSARALAVSTTTTEAESAPTSGGAAAVLYYVREGKLIPVTRSLPDRRLGTVINALLEPPEPIERIGGLGSSIPAGTELLGLQVDGDTVDIDLSREFENVVGTSRQQAFAELVMTATEFPDVRNLRFRVEGKEIQVTSPTQGDTTTVGDCDFESFLPTADEARLLGLDAATTERLDLRRSALEDRCPTPTTARS